MLRLANGVPEVSVELADAIEELVDAYRDRLEDESDWFVLSSYQTEINGDVNTITITDGDEQEVIQEDANEVFTRKTPEPEEGAE